MMTEETFVDSVDQDQTAQNVQPDLQSTLSTFSFLLRMTTPSSMAASRFKYNT